MTDHKKQAGEPENSESTPADSEQDRFDPSRLRLGQNFSESVGVKKALMTIPVRKPAKQEFVRVHPGIDFRLETAVLELKEERETYLVDPQLWGDIPGELTPKVLFTAINRQGVVTLWPIRMPGEDGRLDMWNQSALEAAQMAQQHWVRVSSNMSLGAYEVFQATGDIPEPEWPELSLSEILKVAFKGRYIESAEHPVIRQLLGHS
jgi:hypothetical protein